MRRCAGWINGRWEEWDAPLEAEPRSEPSRFATDSVDAHSAASTLADNTLSVGKGNHDLDASDVNKGGGSKGKTAGKLFSKGKVNAATKGKGTGRGVNNCKPDDENYGKGISMGVDHNLDSVKGASSKGGKGKNAGVGHNQDSIDAKGKTGADHDQAIGKGVSKGKILGDNQDSIDGKGKGISKGKSVGELHQWQARRQDHQQGQEHGLGPGLIV